MSIFIEESMLRKIQGLLEKFVDTGIYGKITVYFEIKRMFYQMTSHPKFKTSGDVKQLESKPVTLFKRKHPFLTTLVVI